MSAQPKKFQKIMAKPIHLVYKFFQAKARVEVWLFENTDMRIEGNLTGFDEFMNLVLEEAEEVYPKKNERRDIGKIMVKGDNITLICNISE